jgi:hypothetical protein
MPYIIVVADFPGVTSEKRKQIFECLQKEKWKRVEGLGLDVLSTWFAKFKDGTKEETAIETTIKDFEGCTSNFSFYRPTLIIQFGFNKPKFHRLNSPVQLI